MLYFDHASGMIPEKRDLEILKNMYLKFPANQEAIHIQAYACRSALAAAKMDLARTLCGSENFRTLPFSSGTEAIAFLDGWQKLQNKRVFTTKMEHPAVVHTLKRLNCSCVFAKTDNNGIITDPGAYAHGCDAVFIHHIQNETGIVQDPDGIFKSFPGAIRIVDTVQSAAKLPLPADADIMIVSGAKFGVPGAAALLIRKELFPELEELYEKKRKSYLSSRINIPDFLAMTAVAARHISCMTSELEHAVKLQKLCRRLAGKCKVRCTIDIRNSSPYICHLMMPENIEGAVILRLLGENGIAAGSGSACSAETKEPSAALRALGYSKKESFRGLRLSFAYNTSLAGIKKLFEVLEKTLKNY